MSWAEVQVAREDGTEASPEEPGEIVVRSRQPNTLFQGYYKNPTATKENISSYEVERTVNSHPAVAESAAVGVPSDLGEDVLNLRAAFPVGEVAFHDIPLLGHAIEIHKQTDWIDGFFAGVAAAGHDWDGTTQSVLVPRMSDGPSATPMRGRWNGRH